MLQLLRYAMFGAVATVVLVLASSTAVARPQSQPNARPTIILVHGAFAEATAAR